MPIDYEKEYDNRARVPEHPEIFARWEAETKAYRAASPHAQLGVSYGPSKRQTIDMFSGKGAGADAPLALFIHGGWWRSLDPSMFSQLAKGPNANGVDVAVVGYDLCPTVPIANIIEQMRAAVLFLWREHKKRIFVYGHSAGGHLTACMVATDWKTLAPDAPADLVPAGYSISGVFDLAPLTKVSQNADLRLTEKSAHEVSPLYWQVPPGRILDAVVGGIESGEFLRQSKIVVQAWRQGMVQTRYEEIAGANHFTVLDPLNDPDSAMTRRVVELARQVQAMAL
jgi:arylformamidase